MAELADALDLGSSGRPCRFKSCYPHYELRRFMIFREASFFIAEPLKSRKLLFLLHNFFA